MPFLALAGREGHAESALEARESRYFAKIHLVHTDPLERLGEPGEEGLDNLATALGPKAGRLSPDAIERLTAGLRFVVGV
jgi:hypothetical protein